MTDNIKRVWYAVGPHQQQSPHHGEIRDDAEPGYSDGYEERSWSVSPREGIAGWETDCSHPGYGLTKAEAEFLAECTRLRAALEEMEAIYKSNHSREPLLIALRDAMKEKP